MDNDTRNVLDQIFAALRQMDEQALREAGHAIERGYILLGSDSADTQRHNALANQIASFLYQLAAAKEADHV